MYYYYNEKKYGKEVRPLISKILPNSSMEIFLSLDDQELALLFTMLFTIVPVSALCVWIQDL